jgi:hypothetical protein
MRNKLGTYPTVLNKEGTVSSPHVTNTCSTTVNVNSTYSPSPYRAVNTLRLGYKNQSVNAV